MVCFTGDGGLYYHIAELETAARHGINVVVVVNDNAALNQEIPLVTQAYRDKPDDRSGELWRFQKKADLVKVAEAFGCSAVRVERPADLAKLLSQALSSDRPVLLDCISDERALAPKAWLPSGRAGH